MAGLRRRRTVPAGDAGKVAPARAAHMSNSSYASARAVPRTPAYTTAAARGAPNTYRARAAAYRKTPGSRSVPLHGRSHTVPPHAWAR